MSPGDGRHPPIPTRETPRLLLRPWHDDDLAAWARITSDPAVMRYLGDGAPLSRDEAADQLSRLRSMWQEHGLGHWAVQERASGMLVGRIGLAHHDDWVLEPGNVEVGWVLERGSWGKGYASEGGAEALRFGFEDRGLRRVISIAHPANQASLRLMARLGLSYGGGARWRGHDVVWYAIERRPGEHPRDAQLRPPTVMP